MKGDTQFSDTLLDEHSRRLNITPCRLVNSYRYSAGATPPTIKWVMGVTQQWCKSDDSPPSTGEFRNVSSYTYTSPHFLKSCTETTWGSFIFRVKLPSLLDFSILKMENLRSSETSVTIYQSAWRKIPDIFYFNQFGWDNLKSRTVRDVFRDLLWEIQEDWWAHEFRIVHLSHYLTL